MRWKQRMKLENVHFDVNAPPPQKKLDVQNMKW